MQSLQRTQCSVFQALSAKFRQIPAAVLGRRDSPHSLLAAELWLQVLSLCEPSPHLPATCRLILNALGTPGSSSICRIWSHRIIFLNPVYDPAIVNRGSSPAQKSREANLSYACVAQIESRLSYYLKAHAPSAIGGAYRVATGLAPQKAETNTSTTLFTKQFVEWLFSSRGPVGGGHGRTPCNVDIDVEMRAIRNERLLVTSGLDSGTLDFPNWRPLPDALLLVHFFIRTSQLDLFQHALTHLLLRYPKFATFSAPISLWAHFMVDNRSRLLCDLSTLVHFEKDPSINYPTFLCLLASFDWSPAALTIIQRTFASFTNFKEVAETITSTLPMQKAILNTLFQMTSPASTADRVLGLLAWYESHGNLLGDPFVSNHVTSLDSTGSYPVASRVFIEYICNTCFTIQVPQSEMRTCLGAWLWDGKWTSPRGTMASVWH